MTYKQQFASGGGPDVSARGRENTARPALGDPTRLVARLLHLRDGADVRDRIALTGRSADGGPVRLTYGQLAAAVAAVGHTLRAAGVAAGDRVAIVAAYGPDWVSAFLGILAHGAVAVPLDPYLAAPEAGALLRDTGPAVVLFGPGTEEKARAALDAAGIAARAQPVPDRAAASSDLPPVPRRLSDPALIVYTSGATGPPRGVTISWGNLAYQVPAAVRQQQASDEVVFVSVLPSHHMLELTAGCLAPLYAGGRVHYPGSMLPADIEAAVAEHRATDLVVVPLLLTALRRRIEADRARAHGLRCIGLTVAQRIAAGAPFRLRRLLHAPLHARLGGRLRRLLVGGAPLDRDLAAYFRRLGFHVCQGYGLTEASPIVSANTPWEHRPGSAGRPLAGTEVRTDAAGGILVRGPGVMLGYWGRPELTAEAVDAGGWLRTGDLGFVDPDGYVFVTGRAKNLIVLPNGENVQPEEVESAIRGSGLVGEVCVLGVAGPRGEEVVAVVTAGEQAQAGPAAGTDPASHERALVDDVRRLTGGLAPHKRPSSIVVHDGRLPQTPTRKIERAGVRELLDHRLGGEHV